MVKKLFDKKIQSENSKNITDGKKMADISNKYMVSVSKPSRRKNLEKKTPFKVKLLVTIFPLNNTSLTIGLKMLLSEQRKERHQDFTRISYFGPKAESQILAYIYRTCQDGQLASQ